MSHLRQKTENIIKMMVWSGESVIELPIDEDVVPGKECWEGGCGCVEARKDKKYLKNVVG
jgi:hypothetical protein